MDATAARRRMVDSLLDQGVLHDVRIRDALLAVPREAFCHEDPCSDVSPLQRIGTAYRDEPQSIGQGQTISAPHMVAIMVEALDVHPGMRVLEVGGGSGYHAAILAHLGARVVSVEIVPQLAERARKTLHELGILGVDVVVGDGSEGYAHGAPYDRISVAAAAPSVPRVLLDQLAPGGSMVIPVGPLEQQSLLRVDATGESAPLMAVRFVPLLGKNGWWRS